MIQLSRQLLILMLVPCFSLLMGCSSDDEGHGSGLVNLDGVFVAESDSEYVKMISIKTNHKGVGTFAIIHHQIPVIDFKVGLQTNLMISHSGGGIEGATSLPVGSDISGGITFSGHYVSSVDFIIESSNRIKYMVRTWSETGYYDKQPISTMSGYLVKTDSPGVLSFFEKEVGSLKQRNIGYTLGVMNQEILVYDEKQKFDESYCQSHFLNSCSELVRLGLLSTHGGGLNKPILNSPVTPNSGLPQGGTPPPHSGIVPHNQQHKQQKGPSQSQPPLLKDEWKMIIDPPGSPDEKPYPYIKIEKRVDIKTFVDNATIRCENEDDCPESVALLIGFDGNSVFQCSATHIGNGYFTSNAHCVPSNLVFESTLSFSKNCSGSLWVKFPKTSVSEPATYECEELVMVTLADKNPASEDTSSEETMDMTIFKVKGEVNREHLEINWDNQSVDGDLVTFWPSDPDQSQPGIHGVIRKKTCEVSDRRGLIEILLYSDWNYPISYLKDCSSDIIKGNSGSTAFNEDHQGTLVISHTYGSGTGRGFGSNYICSYNKPENEEMVDKSTDHCSWISDEHRDLLKEKIKQMLAVERDREWRKQNNEVESFLRALYKVQDDFYKNNEENRTKIYEEFFSESYYDLAEGHVSSEDIENLKKYLKNFSNTEYYTNSVGFENVTRISDGLKITRYRAKLSSDFEVIELTTSNGSKHRVEKPGSRTGLNVEFVALPSCIGPLSKETLESYRSDNTYNPFDTKAYHPIKFRFPVVMVRQARWENSPKALNWNELEKLHLEFMDNRQIPVSTVFEFELSDFYDSENDRIKTPTVTITEINLYNTNSTESDSKNLRDFRFYGYGRVKQKLQSLDFCQ